MEVSTHAHMHVRLYLHPHNAACVLSMRTETQGLGAAVLVVWMHLQTQFESVISQSLVLFILMEGLDGPDRTKLVCIYVT